MEQHKPSSRQNQRNLASQFKVIDSNNDSNSEYEYEEQSYSNQPYEPHSEYENQYSNQAYNQQFQQDESNYNNQPPSYQQQQARSQRQNRNSQEYHLYEQNQSRNAQESRQQQSQNARVALSQIASENGMIITGLIQLIKQKVFNRVSPSESYSTFLMTSGPKELATRFMQEASMLAINSTSENASETMVKEIANIIYDVIMMLEMQGLTFEKVCDELAERVQKSGGDILRLLELSPSPRQQQQQLQAQPNYQSPSRRSSQPSKKARKSEYESEENENEENEYAQQYSRPAKAAKKAAPKRKPAKKASASRSQAQSAKKAAPKRKPAKKASASRRQQQSNRSEQNDSDFQ